MNDLDRLSSLPEEVLGHLLSFLPTRCAVRTSILSTRWRYTFTLTNCLSFDDGPCFGGSENDLRMRAKALWWSKESAHIDLETNKALKELLQSFKGIIDDPEKNEMMRASSRRFKEFVDKVLELHRNYSPIRKLSLVLHGTYDDSDLNRWIGTIARNGVIQEFKFKNFGEIGEIYLPDGFFMCQTLVRLKITSRFIGGIQIPLSPSLPKLKILHLEKLSFVDFDSMEGLFSACELLEELTLKNCLCLTDGHVFHRTGMLKALTIEDCCFKYATFEIDAPNLAYLTFCSNNGVIIVPSWKDSSSFVKAELGFSSAVYNDSGAKSSDCELLKAAAYKTTSLSFQILHKLGDEQMPGFNSLTTLELNLCLHDSWKYVTSLVDKSPQLETVVFEMGLHCCKCICGSECDSESSLPDISPLSTFSCHARVIEVHNLCEHGRSLSLMGHLLRNASVLKKLIVSTVRRLDLESEMKISNDVLMLPRASMDCCVEMNKVENNTANHHRMTLIESSSGVRTVKINEVVPHFER